ncbi:MAG: hypothetical protein K5668_05165 [Lachnospiraceae bacterium]|nr:hypothetical protein [Lachnospiraceae bacterium]
MSDIGNLQLGNIKKKKEDLNKTGGINTSKSVFDTENDSGINTGSYAMPGQQPFMTRVEELANRGPLMQTRVHTQNSNDIAFPQMKEKEKTHPEAETTGSKVRSEEGQNIIKAKPELKVFSEDVMKKGTFTPQAKEVARRFFNQVTAWAGKFDDGGSGFYSSMGISGVLDCLYVDGMSFRNYLKEQYFFKNSNDPAQDLEAARNYLALIAARGEHIITMVRPNVKGDSAEVEYKNMYVDLSDVGGEEAQKSKALKEKGNQVRSDMKKRMDSEMTERTGRAFRKAYDKETAGFKRLEDAGDSVKDAGDENSDEYKTFEKSFEKYNNGMQKLGLKPGRDDINLAAAEELKKRCSDALKAADEFLQSGSKNKRAIEAAKKAKQALETDLELLDRAINTKLGDEAARMRLDELFDDGKADDPKKDPNTGSDDNDNDGNDPEDGEDL